MILRRPPMSGSERGWLSRRLAEIEASRFALQRQRAVIDGLWQAMQIAAAARALTASEAERMDRLGEAWDRLGDEIARLDREIQELEWECPS